MRILSFISISGKRLLFVIVLLAVLLFVFAACDQELRIRHYTVSTSKTGKQVRLAVLADLHSTLYGDGQEELLDAIRQEEPDLVVLVGDIVDDKLSDAGARILLEMIGQEYPCYYVSGNHEYWSGKIEDIKAMIASYKVTVLEGESIMLRINGQDICLCGVDDPDGFSGKYSFDALRDTRWEVPFRAIQKGLDENQYSILLTHRPELTDFYTDSGFDLIVAGHAHGGQVRIPGILNGLYAPGQGVLPQYVGGLYELGDTDMVVSRGLCRDEKPRIFNHPELVIVDIIPETGILL